VILQGSKNINIPKQS